MSAVVCMEGVREITVKTFNLLIAISNLFVFLCPLRSVCQILINVLIIIRT